MKKIAFLTCGRSDFSIYLPLIKQLKKLKFQITIIAFGSHGSKIYGSAMQDIEAAKVHEIIYIDSLNKKFSNQTCENSELMVGKIVCLPMSSSFTRDEIGHIHKSLTDVLTNIKAEL